jgi:tetratricopeptide (TPR) repeat protein
MKNKFHNRSVVLLSLIGFLFSSCNEPEVAKTSIVAETNSNTYLNHSDTAKYVGMNTCKLCHQDIYNSFIKTGMGKSFDLASSKKSVANFANTEVYDRFLDLHYKAYLQKDSLYIHEYRIDQKDTLYTRTEQVNFIIGSGQHTNSHIQSVNGYLNQMPMTFYSQKQKWDLPPGFENGVNTRFTRKIGLECMSCHNGYPNFVMGSENKYSAVPQGIDCERCHGPGNIHVAQKQAGILVDTSKQIDYSIVNPSKLSIDLQFDICQRCHLQGNAVLKNDHSFYDFKPGKKLNNYMSVFLPKYKNADDEFIMASHADRLKQSACFIKSIEKTKSSNSLKPYKEAMTCITCHNPHISVRETNKEIFNDACRKCHVNELAEGSKQLAVSSLIPTKTCQVPTYQTANCVSCHMPSSGSIDIPHVSVHDHYIRKPISSKEKNKIKEFIGLYTINEAKPDAQTKAMAYIQQYEKFEQNRSYLDSAKVYLKDVTKTDIEKNLHALLKLEFIKGNYGKILTYVNTLNEDVCYNKYLLKRSYDNKDAWCAYHIAESFLNTGNGQKAMKWFAKACELAPYNLDFKNKYGNALAQANLIEPAKQQFELVLKENPTNISATTNLGYLYLLSNQEQKAISLYLKGLKLDPDYEPLLMNLTGYYLFKKDKENALRMVNKILQKNPKNAQAKAALKQIQMLY